MISISTQLQLHSASVNVFMNVFVIELQNICNIQCSIESTFSSINI